MRVRDPVTGRWAKAPNPQDKAITAAVATVPTADLEKLPRNAEGWQTRGWRLWRILGVLYFPTSFKAKQVARLGWKVEVDGKELNEEQAEAALEAVTGPLSVREAARRLALNYEVAGEVWYVRMQDEWNVLAATTPKLKNLLRGADIKVHAWQPDPEYPDKPTSSIQAALATAEQIRLLCALSRAQDRNRLSQRGILLIPKEGQFPDDDPFIPKLEASITAPLADEYSGSAVVPLVTDYPSEYIDKWRHLVLETPYDEKLMARIEAAIKQLALELDMPPEMLLGNMDSNHWNAWLSSEENYRAHVEPLGESVGEIFAEAMMQAVNGSMLVKVTPDPTQLLMRKLSFEDALAALKNLVVGFDYVREVARISEDAAPTDEEIALILALQGQTAPGTDVAPVATAPALPPTSGAPEMPSGTGAAPPSPAPGSNGNAVTASASRERELDTLSRRLTDMDIHLLAVLEGLAEMSVSHVRATVESAGDVVGTPHIVAGEMERLGAAWNRELDKARNSLGHLGIDATGEAWDLAQEASVHLLTAEMGAFITDTIDVPDSELPAIPVLVLRQALATAGGSGTATVAALTRNPAPTFSDPQGFALGVLTVKDLKDRDVELVQWRFRYGPLTRTAPFIEHKDVDGQYMTSDGATSEGWYPGDHKGCECWADPVFRDVLTPDEVADAVAEGD